MTVTTEKKAASPTLGLTRRLSAAGVDPFKSVPWNRRLAEITGGDGKAVFSQAAVEAPEFWSDTAVNIVASKYFHGQQGTPARETSVRQLVSRVVDTIVRWGIEQGHLSDPEEASILHDELVLLLLYQRVSFNSPVWFNLGAPGARQQVSACFINSVEDTMESILELAKTEGMLFKYGSGSGSNLSKLRGTDEPLHSGGSASGPVSFMRGLDAFAGVIKSGGTTRRAAKMVLLDVDHPDILDFINCKVAEEKKAHALIEAGYDGSFTGEAYRSVFFQNSNNSVRVTDAFMQAVEADGDWLTYSRTDPEKVAGTYKARDLMRAIAEAAWACGDPGVQYDTTINAWHTSPNSGRINASNPCSEFVYLDDTACNLASINLMKFVDEAGEFQVEDFKAAVRIFITAMEIMVGGAEYPTEKIARNSVEYRPLGLGYANLGALLMSWGLAYDSDQGRAAAASITALMTGEAYAQSARLAAKVGPFAGFEQNREPMLQVIQKHSEAAHLLPGRGELVWAAAEAWDEAQELGAQHGYRNAQVSVLAPTGTISFMMDCDTTGVEPDIALVKFKKLVGGGLLKIVNGTVPAALERLGYEPEAISRIVAHIDEHDTIEGAADLKPEHLSVFDCSFKPANGERSIEWQGHVKMIAAVQPFLSGAVSKTVNLPNSATVEDIEEAYTKAWKLGVKAIAVYRDGCKLSQPVATSREQATFDGQAHESDEPVHLAVPIRRRLPVERSAITHKFDIQGHEGYLTVGLYDDGSPGELFVRMAKEGSTLSGIMDSWATVVSVAIQYGVPLSSLCAKFANSRFEPSGWTGYKAIPMAKSIVDYIAKWMALKFLTAEEAELLGVHIEKGVEEDSEPGMAGVAARQQGPNDLALGSAALVATTPSLNGNGHVTIPARPLSDAPCCSQCGSIAVRPSGACLVCADCGASSGCS
ncbi:MAG: vitamin B12-dependent ribonucleotide reductase [Candidatus Dormibacteria bacterium]